MADLDSIMTEVTDDFCESFGGDRDYTGPVARLIGTGSLPEMVDENDPRVIEIVRRCAEASGE